jgi:FAD:protein FMN transferase
MMKPMTRRRFIRITAVAAGLSAAAPLLARGTASPMLHRWSGVALGADASLALYHPDAAEAQRLITATLAEVKRLERVFSLYDQNSALCQLNRQGMLQDPPQELVALLSDCARYSQATGGAFDVTVQPLWDLYAAHFSQAVANPAGPSPTDIARATARVDHRAVEVAPDLIRFLKPGMSITLNGIAQGYITDRVAELLRASGVQHTLIDMGETRALDSHPAGRPWDIGLRDPADGSAIVATVPLDNAAIATSGGYGTQFDDAGRFNHIFDPATGACASRYASVSVVAPIATTADALSTALSLLPIARAEKVLANCAANAAWFILNDGRIERHTAAPRDHV